MTYAMRLLRRWFSPLRRSPVRNARLRVQGLESREVPAGFVVSSLANSGAGTLRQAVLDANANGTGLDTITFSTSGTITLASELTVSGSLIIQGGYTPGGSHSVSLSGGNATRLFNSSLAAASISFTVNDVNMFNGKGDANGGGILLAGDENVTFKDCYLNSSTSTGDGGAIRFTEPIYGKLTLNRCFLSGNSAANGGAVAFEVGGASVIASNTVFRSNTATGQGGALRLLNFDAGSSVNLLNSTLTGNRAADGGAIRLQNFSGALLLVHCTVTGNTVTANGGGINAFGGTGSIALENTVLSGNVDTTGGTSPDCENNGIAFKYKFSAVGSSAGLTAPVNQGGNLAFGTDLKLSSGTVYLGTVDGFVPQAGSPLINNGTTATTVVLTDDQRGAPAVRNFGGAPDIGSVEVQSLNMIVDNAGDGIDYNHAAGQFTLREAVNLATYNPGADSVGFNLGGAATIALTSEIGITDSLTIAGPGAGSLSLSGSGTNRIFNVTSATATLNVANVTLTAGSATGSGGAISAVAGSTVGITASVLSGNKATIDGGAIMTNGTLTIDGSTLSGNSAATGTNGSGGAVWTNSNLTVTNSTISGNAVLTGLAGYGGAFSLNSGSGSAWIIRNSTIANNTAKTSGGGISLASAYATFNVQNSTIVGNTAQGGSGGGGIARVSGTTIINLSSTIVSGNDATANANEDLFSSGTVNANNCAFSTTTGFTPTGAGNLVAAHATLALGTLANNGGPVQTMRPAGTSTVVDKGSNPAGLTTDARGVSRVWGGAADIGAVEVPITTAVLNANNAGAGSLRQAILDANLDAGSASTITFDPTAFASAQTITLTSEIAVSGSVSINGTGADRLALKGSGATRAFNVSGAGNIVVNFAGLTLTGFAPSAGTGGAVQVADEYVTFDGVAVRGNTSPFQGGGVGFTATGGKLTVLNSEVSGNTAAGDGGGLYTANTNQVVIRNSTLSGNSAGGRGGAFCALNWSASSSFSLQNTTVTANTAVGNGGGIRVTPGGAA
ncbi:MAG: right-handed parallel beta-helix repeat-containing protein, partial [Gemmataceae bacterium]|nr:right-handed parallel beta-helix repeat-containing protein [Gemmataceae bacterium]